MVEVIKVPQYTPRVEIHTMQRFVHGNCTMLKSIGEILIAAKEYVYAWQLGLKTIETMRLTAEGANHAAYIPQKWVYHKGEYDNYASIDIFDAADAEITAGSGPSSGSVWLNYVAEGDV